MRRLFNALNPIMCVSLHHITQYDVNNLKIINIVPKFKEISGKFLLASPSFLSTFDKHSRKTSLVACNNSSRRTTLLF